jgi:hypothetical protein
MQDLAIAPGGRVIVALELVQPGEADEAVELEAQAVVLARIGDPLDEDTSERATRSRRPDRPA